MTQDTSTSENVTSENETVDASTSETANPENKDENIDGSSDENGTEKSKKSSKTGTTRRKARDYLAQFRELVKANKNEEEIRVKMKIDQIFFNKLFRVLCDEDQVYYKIPSSSSSRTSKVKETGFMVSRSRLNDLRLGGIFAENKVLKFRREGNSLVVDVADNPTEQM